MSEKTFNFDDFWREKNGKNEKKTITIEGKEWELKPELPAEASLMALKMMDEKGAEGEVTIDEIVEVYNSIMGKKQVEKLIETGIGTQKLFGLMQYIMQEVYDLNPETEDEEKEGNTKTQQTKQ